MRKYLIGAGAAVVLVLTAGCGSSDGATAGGSAPGGTASSSSTEQPGHNAADVRFAQRMIPHHRQAVAMAEMVLQRSTDPELRRLAKRIKTAQVSEIGKLKAMLNAWGEPVPSGTSGMSGTGHGSGMMSAEQMRSLKQAGDAKFETMWIQMMIEHHRGAIEMAKRELARGTNPAARKLARNIIEAQQAEIREMKAMLAE